MLPRQCVTLGATVVFPCLCTTVEVAAIRQGAGEGDCAGASHGKNRQAPPRSLENFARISFPRVHFGCLQTGWSDRQRISFRCHGSWCAFPGEVAWGCMSDHVMSEVVLQVSCSRCRVRLLHEEQENNYTQMMTINLFTLREPVSLWKNMKVWWV